MRPPGGAPWSERMVLGAYLSLHWIDAASWVTATASWTSMLTPRSALRHREYVEALPPRGSLQSPLQFTPVELDLLAGTNLLGATRDKEAQLRAELAQVQTVLPTITWSVLPRPTSAVSDRLGKITATPAPTSRLAHSHLRSSTSQNPAHNRQAQSRLHQKKSRIRS